MFWRCSQTREGVRRGSGAPICAVPLVLPASFKSSDERLHLVIGSMMPQELPNSKVTQWQTHAIHTSGLPVFTFLPSSTGHWGFIWPSQWASGPLWVEAVKFWCSLSEAENNISHITCKFFKKRKHVVKNPLGSVCGSLTYFRGSESTQAKQVCKKKDKEQPPYSSH